MVGGVLIERRVYEFGEICPGVLVQGFIPDFGHEGGDLCFA